MIALRQGLAVATILASMTATALAGDVVVLKGGAVIDLKQPWVRRGNTAYLTRADGTLLSVPVAEIDTQATAAARQAAPAAPPADAAQPSTPAEVVRAKRDVPKARVKITDADVSHPMDLSAAAAVQEKKDQALTQGSAKVEIAQYDQETKGPNLIVKGQIRNPTQTTAENVKLIVTSIDEKGLTIDSQSASLSKGDLESGDTVDFSTSLTVGDRVPATLRFAPSWTAPRPVPTPRPAKESPGGAAAASAPKPRPTPYGRGSISAAPAANAPTSPQADGSGYIPNPTSPDNQPKPPVP